MDKSVDDKLNQTMPHIKTATVGMQGIDINRPLSIVDITNIRIKQFDFVCRYVGRVKQVSTDLSLSETNNILNGGLGIIAVQHVETPKWIPSLQKGNTYGQNAATFAEDCGLTPGTIITLDLEEVDKSVPTEITIDYCNQWHSVVAGRGFLPMLYVGDTCGISAHDLYYKLRFTHYWGAYNLNADCVPVIRGLQMQQRAKTKKDSIVGISNFDINVIQKDNLGGLPVILTNA